MRFRLLMCLALLLPSISAVPRSEAQSDPAASPATPPTPRPDAPRISGYTVTGRVICADTQRPARFAQVTLLPALNSSGDSDRGRRAVARTDLDGHFEMDNVPAGDYFATAEMTGYINDAPAVQAALSAGGDALNAVSSVPRVQVSAGGASAQLSLQRGAVVAGTVQWDDGSPAAGVQVAAQAAGTQGSPPASRGQGFGRQGGFSPGAGGAQTDDKGRFRLSGLPSGSYVVRANLQSPLPQTTGGVGGGFPRVITLRVFAPNKLRQTDADVFTLAPGEERGDVSITLALAGMHTVSGQVSSSGAAVRSGSVQLTDQSDASLNRSGAINPDGSFTVPYVPPGTYSLRVTASSQLPTNGRGGGSGSSGDAGVRFQPLQESITVVDSDLTGLTLSVTQATATP